MRTKTLEWGIYSLALAFLLLLGFESLQSSKQAWSHGPSSRRAWAELHNELQGEAEALAPTKRSWKYTGRWLPWWSKIASSDWVGKQPRRPVTIDGSPRRGGLLRRAALEPVADLIELTMILADSEHARIKVRYKAAESEAPRDEIHASAEAFHELHKGDALRAPHNHIKFIGLDFSDSAALFARPGSRTAGQTTPIHERLYRVEVLPDERFVQGLTSNTRRRNR